MAARRPRHQLERGVALLGDADRGDLAREARQHARLEQRVALIEDEGRAHAAGGQGLGDAHGAGRTAYLLVVSEGQDHRAARREALRQQRLDRLADRHQGAFVVDRATAPHEAVGDCAGEGRMGPELDALGRHDVVVREEQDRRERGIAARPGIHERMVGDALQGERIVEPRVARRQPGGERVEGLGLQLRGIRRVGDGGDADRLGEPLRRRLRVDGARRGRRHRNLARRELERAHRQQAGGEDQHQQRDAEQA